MKKKPSDIQKLKRQIETCLFDGLRLAFFLPNQEIRNPTWDEFKDGVTEGYAMALKDVLAAIDGNTEPLEEAMMEGRLFIAEGDRELFLEKLEEAVENPSAFFDDDENEE
ncbi:MAG: hypothetical protein ACLP5H_17900 [Desulfomonilaceae bacterium]